MVMDFTRDIYQKLIASLKIAGYSFQTFSDFLRNKRRKTVVLRHDVDKLPRHSIVFARLQAQMGIRGSYYFRAVPESWNEKVIKEIAAMGHEVGYHYENLTTVARRFDRKLKNGGLDQLLAAGIADFESNLQRLRKLVSVQTICMHGSPLSRFDSKDLWKKYNYNDFGIIGEPYFDIDFEEVFYLTDTGRRWDGYRVSVRDKVPQFQEHWEQQGLVYRSTYDIIQALETRRLPDKIMMTFHPQRWHGSFYSWFQELCWQNLKNQYKRFLINKRGC
jgi:hypothetical protein